MKIFLFIINTDKLINNSTIIHSLIKEIYIYIYNNNSIVILKYAKVLKLYI